MTGTAKRCRQLRRLLQFAAAAIACLLTAPVAAQSAPASLDATLESAFTEGTETQRGINLMQRVGVTYQGYGVVERAPKTGGYAVETRLRWREFDLRFPVKVRRADDQRWQISWAPRSGYAEALIALLDEGSIATLPAKKTDRWADQQRLPALPVLLTEDGATTPFGNVPLSSKRDVEPPEALAKHVTRWIDDVIGGANGPAAIDIIAAKSTPWRSITKTSYAAAAAGFFRLHLIAKAPDSSRLGAFSALLPVFSSGETPGGASSFVVGMYTGGDTPGFRVSVGDQLLDASDDCSDDMTLCPDGLDAFSEQLIGAVKATFSDGPPDISHVMFAATGATTLNDALPFARRLPDALGIPASRLFIGHIGRAESGGNP